MAWHNPFPPYTKSPTNKEKKSKRGVPVQRAVRRSPSRSPPLATRSTHEDRDPKLEPQLVQYYIMNLPDSALTFLDAFWGLYTPLADEPGFKEKSHIVGLPIVCVYCFTKEIERAAAANDIYEVCHGLFVISGKYEEAFLRIPPSAPRTISDIHSTLLMKASDSLFTWSDRSHPKKTCIAFLSACRKKWPSRRLRTLALARRHSHRLLVYGSEV